jgi:hypothetical protein
LPPPRRARALRESRRARMCFMRGSGIAVTTERG